MHKYIDAHCHLPCEIPLKCSGAVINAVKAAEWPGIQVCAAINANTWGAIGIHPQFVATANEAWATQMRNMLRKNPSLMVGEIGLDKNYPSIAAQIDIFARQLDIAAEFNRVAHIHCVGMWDVMLTQLGNARQRVVMHSFGGSVDVMRQILRTHDAYISFSPRVLDEKFRRMRECAATAPADKILVESDGACGDGAAALPRIVEEIATLRHTDTNELADTIYNNTQRMLQHG